MLEQVKEFNYFEFLKNNDPISKIKYTYNKSILYLTFFFMN